MKRLNKYINDAGYCSRREADKYIEQGRVTINGRDADLGSMVEDGDVVAVDGERVGRSPQKRAVYIAFNKPVGITSTTDKADKTNIVDYIRYKERIFPVGRLDKDSEGLIILTNDGDIVNKILRAGNNNPKEYIVTVDKPITAEFIKIMSQGVRILGVTTKPCKIFRQNETTFTIYLTQGLNRQIRRMAQVLGYKVVKLKRLRVMNISLGGLEPGRWRLFTAEETTEMQRLLELSSGTEEASDERRDKSKGSFADYRKKGRPGSGKTAGSYSKGSFKKNTPSRSDSAVGKKPVVAKSAAAGNPSAKNPYVKSPFAKSSSSSGKSKAFRGENSSAGKSKTPRVATGRRRSR